MDCHAADSAVEETGADDTVILVGNANVGKSVIFGLLTGKYVTVSNYPGTTVEVSRGNMTLGGTRHLVVDTPGVNGLIPMSEDEEVTRNILLSLNPSCVLQVGDYKNVKRTLLLALQLAEMELPLVLDLNIEDEARDKGIIVDKKRLSELLGVDVVSTVAPERKGIKELRAAVSSARRPAARVKYPPLVEEYAGRIAALLPRAPISRRSLALMILAGDRTLRPWIKANVADRVIDAIESLRDECALKLGASPANVISEARIRAAEAMAEEVTERIEAARSGLAAAFGDLCMHHIWGVPILLTVLFLLYEFVGVFGAGTLVDYFESTIFGEYVNPAAVAVVDRLVPVPFLRDMLVGEYGLVTVALTYAIAIILPITATFFIAFAVLEDSGYLPRLAIMSNSFFNRMGLNGKAVLPMVLGFGCGTMAVMTSRILESPRDRIITTFLLALAIPCSAQLGVILGILGSLSFAATVIWAGSLAAVMFVAGYLAAKVIPGDRSDFFMEIPPIRVPNARNVLFKTLGRVRWYLREAVPLFLLGTFILFMLDKLNLLDIIEELASPVVVDFVGLPAKATEAFIMGFLRRDYGAAGLYMLFENGEMTSQQALVSLVTITLFVPCLANFFMIVKERGTRTALLIIAIVFPLAFLVGGALNRVLALFPGLV